MRRSSPARRDVSSRALFGLLCALLTTTPAVAYADGMSGLGMAAMGGALLAAAAAAAGVLALFTHLIPALIIWRARHRTIWARGALWVFTLHCVLGGLGLIGLVISLSLLLLYSIRDAPGMVMCVAFYAAPALWCLRHRDRAWWFLVRYAAVSGVLAAIWYGVLVLTDNARGDELVAIPPGIFLTLFFLIPGWIGRTRALRLPETPAT